MAMASKKKLKKQAQQAYEDYKSLGRDSLDLVLLYHDIIGLLVEYDGDLFLRSIRAADLERIEKLKAELDEMAEERHTAVKAFLNISNERNRLRNELEKLKALQVDITMVVNGEIVSNDDT